MKNIFINDFRDTDFKSMFQTYFTELGVSVRNWDRLFKAMNDENRNFAYLRYDEESNPIGFIQFTVITFSSGFFGTKMGFIREFWVNSNCRSNGHGSELLQLAEEYFIKNAVHKAILTTNTAEKFYIKHGYTKDVTIKAKNNFDVFIKVLR
ncbi:MAG: GNAT family N-acetyltransferase [Eubacterium sp.]|nr:GNAT family N-acetyltransferase [Eubacterium sp.]